MSEAEPKSPRKRKRASKACDDEESKKQRGRPRLDTQDETAADRRRTQIRLAQRAYRMRKETTISALNKRTSDLQGLIQDMSRTLTQLNMQAVQSGIARYTPDIAQSLNRTAQRFATLAEEALASTADESDGVQTPNASESHQTSQELPPLLMQPPSLWSSAVVRQSQVTARAPHPPHPPALPASHPTIGIGYQLMYDDTNSESRYHEQIPVAGRRNSFDDQYHLLPLPHIHHDLPSMFKMKTIQSPYTYSFQEKTFARRLQRASIERGYYLLSQPTSRPEVFRRVFRLSLLTGSREDILAKFKALLTKSTEESLDFWSTPFLHVGGAGTHYARRDEYGNIMPKPNSYSVLSIGPHKIARLTDASGAGMSPDMLVDLTGFEGEWFDAHDVEGYLREQGFVIDPQSSFAEAEMSSSPATPRSLLSRESTMSENSPPLTPQSDSQLPATFPFDLLAQYDYTNPTGIDVLSAHYYPGLGPINSRRAASKTAWATPDASPVSAKPRITIDVQHFINELLDRVACLGRTAGFRRADVDRALASAIQSF